MPYSQIIPAATDQASQSQADLLGNFQALYTLIDENHAIFGNPNEGKHKWVSFPEQAAAPATAVNEVALFSGLSAYSAEAELGIRKENNGAVVEFTSSGNAIAGWTYLPSGILLKWGQANTPAIGVTTVVFPVAANIPVFNNVYNIQLTPFEPGAIDTNIFVRLVGHTAVDFDVWGSYRITISNIVMTFNYLAIGD